MFSKGCIRKEGKAMGSREEIGGSFKRQIFLVFGMEDRKKWMQGRRENLRSEQ